MCKCKIGIRNNLYYPLMLIVFILLRNIVEIILSKAFDYEGSSFIIPLFLFISLFFAGIIGRYQNNYSENELFKNKPEIIQQDSKIKIYILILFASYFNYLGSIVRNKSIYFQLENRTRGFQIIFSALLCYFTIRTNIY